MKQQAFNPYLPSWEYIPDGEPYVFDGRVYIYGSHDRFNGHAYCLNDYEMCIRDSLGAGLPLGQARAVGVAGAGEVHKGAGHHLVQHVAGLLVADGHHLPVVEEVGDVRAVPGSLAAV